MYEIVDYKNGWYTLRKVPVENMPKYVPRDIHADLAWNYLKHNSTPKGASNG